jgi:hypothetical protein
MTVSEMIVEVYEMLGEPSDLFPYTAGTTTLDITTPGAIRILKWINRAYKRIINWKFPNGSQIRFPMQSGEMFFSSVVRTGTVVSAGASTVTLDSGVAAADDRYNGCLLAIVGGTGSGQSRLITDFTAARIASVNRDWDTTPDGTSLYEVYRRLYRFRDPAAADVSDHIALSPVDEIAAVLKVTDAGSLYDLTQGGRIETFSTSLENSGIPTCYITQNGILFDVYPDEARWYRLEYSKIPTELTALTDSPDVLDSFNEPILLYAQWIGLRRSQEWGGAYASKKDIEDLMSSLKSSLEMAFEREDIGASF